MQAVTIQDILIQGQQVAHQAPQTISAEALDGWSVGTICAQQGDLYFAPLAAVPANACPWPFAHGQLAPGNTQGSRHTVDLRHVRLWTLTHPTALDGPIIEAPDGVEVAHPEHGHLLFPPGVYKVTFQRAYATELRRIAD